MLCIFQESGHIIPTRNGGEGDDDVLCVEHFDRGEFIRRQGLQDSK